MSIESVSSEHRIFHPGQPFVDHANVSGMAAYEKLCTFANENYEKLWAENRDRSFQPRIPSATTSAPR